MAVKTLIESLGVYLPKGSVKTKDIVNGCRKPPVIDLESLTGIKSRRVVGQGEYSLELSINAISKCFEISRHKPADIDILISCSISRYSGPDYKFSAEPSAASRLAAHFGVRRNAVVFDVTNACAGMFNGILIADSFIKSGMTKKALVVSGEYITHLTWNAQKEMGEGIDPQLASLTVGDAGAAVILEGAENSKAGFDEIDMFTIARHSDLCIGTTSDKEHGGYVMYTQSTTLLPYLVMTSAEHVANRLKKSGLDEAGQSHFINHQIASKFVKSVGQMVNSYLGTVSIAGERVVDNLENRGNTASTSHFVALWDYIRNGTIQPFDRIIFGIQASGIVSGFASYTLDDLPLRVTRIPDDAD